MGYFKNVDIEISNIKFVASIPQNQLVKMLLSRDALKAKLKKHKQKIVKFKKI